MNIPPEIYVVLLIIIVGGSLGGLIGAFISEDLDNSWTFCARRMVIGFGAAFLVPLLLNMVSSTLLEQAKTAPSAYLIFAGLCIIAGAATKAVISTAADRLIRQVDQVEDKVRMLRESIEPILIREKEPEARLQFAAGSDAQPPASEPERTILRALNDGAYSMRTLDGIAKQTSLDFNFVSSYISQLQNRGLASNVVGDDNRSFWFLTQIGKMAASLQKI